MMILERFFSSFEQQAATDDVRLIEAWLIMEGPILHNVPNILVLFKNPETWFRRSNESDRLIKYTAGLQNTLIIDGKGIDVAQHIWSPGCPI